jgi:hypothetical protein
MKRTVLASLIAAVTMTAPAQAHYVDYANLKDHVRETNIEGWCGKPLDWFCSGPNYFVIVGDSWDNDGSSREGSHSTEFYAKWRENRPFTARWCELWFRKYHYEFAERYRGPGCWG